MLDKISSIKLALENELQERNFYLTQSRRTINPAGKAMFQIMGVFAEFERAMIRERVLSGMQRAKAQGKRLGRAHTPALTEAAIRIELQRGTGILKTARLHKVGTATVQRIKREMTSCS